MRMPVSVIVIVVMMTHEISDITKSSNFLCIFKLVAAPFFPGIPRRWICNHTFQATQTRRRYPLSSGERARVRASFPTLPLVFHWRFIGRENASSNIALTFAISCAPNLGASLELGCWSLELSPGCFHFVTQAFRLSPEGRLYPDIASVMLVVNDNFLVSGALAVVCFCDVSGAAHGSFLRGASRFN